MTEVKTKAKSVVRTTKAKKCKPKPKVSLREKLIRWLGGVPAPKPKGVKKQSVKAYVRKPATQPGNGDKTAEVLKANKEIDKVLKFAEQNPLKTEKEIVPV